MGIGLAICFKSVRVAIFLSIIIVSFSVCAQDEEENEFPTDSLELEMDKKLFTERFAPYLGFNIEGAHERDGYSLSQQISAGVFYQGFTTGVFYSQGGGKVESHPFFPNDYDLPYKQMGGFIGHSLIRHQKIQIYARINLSHADMNWKNKETGSAVFEDRFYFIKPEVQFCYLPTPFVQFFTSLGYRKAHQLKLTEVKSNQYTGLTLNFGMRLGLFYKQPKE
ncbi:MAG: hypothetical protein ABJN36_15475 [Cyclobacteriaceae bacterium]